MTAGKKYVPSLKGKALLLAIDSGVVKRGVLGKTDISAFMRFWDGLLSLLKEAGYEIDDTADVLIDNSQFKGVNKMDENTTRMTAQDADDKLEALLFEFVERAVKKGATPEEIAALPEVANVLKNIIRF